MCRQSWKPLWVYFRYTHSCSATVILLQSGYILYLFFLRLFLCVCVWAQLLNLCLTLLRPHVLEPIRLLCPWDFPSENTGVGCHALLQGMFPTVGSNPLLLCLLHCRPVLYCWATGEATFIPRPLQTTLYWDCPRSLQINVNQTHQHFCSNALKCFSLLLSMNEGPSWSALLICSVTIVSFAPAVQNVCSKIFGWAFS